MHYIILDLEWNNTYARRTKGFLNEIIEIGAVMLDGKLNTIDKFSCLVNPQVGKKLRGSIKQLTSITNEDIKNGIVFTRAMSKFRDWIGSEENIVLTWGDGDIRVLIENFKYLNGIDTIPFLTNYIDIQQYVQKVLKVSTAQQLGLSHAAEMIGINETEFAHHRALDDSKLTAECFKRTFDKDLFNSMVVPCDKDFYGKLAFKPKALSNINNPLVDKRMLTYKCEKCGCNGELVKSWRYSNQYFRAIYRCPECDCLARVSVRFKKYYDHIETKKNISIINTDNETSKKSVT